mmetsp:Transcript_95863/g.309522  ORF Transcript_95863/g.309522 Transcript_95863/m.309522 type:complete len:235 (-) Transcript_95863:600-1304(-)
MGEALRELQGRGGGADYGGLQAGRPGPAAAADARRGRLAGAAVGKSAGGHRAALPHDLRRPRRLLRHRHGPRLRLPRRRGPARRRAGRADVQPLGHQLVQRLPAAPEKPGRLLPHGPRRVLQGLLGHVHRAGTAGLQHLLGGGRGGGHEPDHDAEVLPEDQQARVGAARVAHQPLRQGQRLRAEVANIRQHDRQPQEEAGAGHGLGHIFRPPLHGAPGRGGRLRGRGLRELPGG